MSTQTQRVVRLEQAVGLASSQSLRMVRWGSGEPVTVLLHGIGDSALAWEPFVERSRPSGTHLAFDLPGHGQSYWSPNGTYSARLIAEQIGEALEALALPSWVLIGHSLGAQIGLHLTAAHPSRTRALVLVEGGPFIAASAAAAIRDALVSAPRVFSAMQRFMETFSASLPLADPEILSTIADDLIAVRADGGFELRSDPQLAHTMSFTADDELVAMARVVRCPCLVVRGAWSSALTPEAARNLTALFLQSQLRELPGAGHAVPLENPGGLAQLVDAFCTALFL